MKQWCTNYRYSQNEFASRYSTQRYIYTRQCHVFFAHLSFETHDPTQPTKTQIFDQFPTQPNPTRGSTQPTDNSGAPILRFFYAASDGATANRQIPDRIFGQYFTSLRKDSVANAWIWTPFSSTVRGMYNICFTMQKTCCSSVGRWHHKIRKFAAEIFQNSKNLPQSCAKYFVWLLLR